MYSLREELRNLDNAVYQKKIEVTKIQQSITDAAIEIADMEDKIVLNKQEAVKIEKKKEELKKTLEDLDNATSPTNDDELMLKRFDELNLQGKPVGSVPPHPHSVFHTNPDPFKSADPFAEDHFDSFTKRNSTSGATASFGKDPFAQA